MLNAPDAIGAVHSGDGECQLFHPFRVRHAADWLQNGKGRVWILLCHAAKIAAKLPAVTLRLTFMTDTFDPHSFFATLLAGKSDTAATLRFLEQQEKQGIVPETLVALVEAMRTHALPFPALSDAIDVCGTGGDGLNTPNISTAVALTLAGCGVPVVKHGNRAASSACGSADVLESLGVRLEVSAETAAQALRQANICFLFARHYHPALRYAAEARKLFGKRSIFNLAGPLANPARPGHQLVGVYDKTWLQPMTVALRILGSTSAWVVHSRDGMDEISTTAPSDVVRLRDGQITSFTLSPADYGISPPPPGALAGGDATVNARLLRGLLAGEAGALQDIVCINAAAALVVAERATDIANGLEMARQSLQNGTAAHALAQLVTITNGKDNR